MPHRTTDTARWILAWLAVSVLACAALAAWRVEQLRAAFDTDARIAHRLLSQRAAQHDAILATLALLQPDASGADIAPVRRLPALYPQVLAVLQRERGQAWPQADLQDAEQRSRQARHAVLARSALAEGRATLLLAAEPSSFALELDLSQPVAGGEWPFAAEGAVRVVLASGAQSLTLLRGATGGEGLWRFAARKTLSSPSQPLELHVERSLSPAELPWLRMALTSVAIALALWALRTLRQQRAARRRAEELLRLGQVTRLNTLGELAAGMAHELNQPLTAVLSGTQAAARMLADDPPDIPLSRQAMDHVAAQARRASDVLARLRRVVQRPGGGEGGPQPVDLAAAARDALELLAPECQRRGVAFRIDAPAVSPVVTVDAVALQQIVHNLVMNALQAMERDDAGPRELVLSVARSADGGTELAVRDSGPGIAPEVLPRLFEPFFSTRSDGLGLGLSLCETLATELGGELRAANVQPRGAQFTLSLPAAVMA